ncbi:MAG: hypothetical protein NZZ41_07950 [Candidatus Dojkabacteria bacterium]|nr:hypothetical protein [Candidatus Dojkabacteria bacterium]
MNGDVMDWTIVLGVIAGVATASGAIVGLINVLRERKWEVPLNEIKNDLLIWKDEMHRKIFEIENQLNNVKSDVEDIKELKEKIKDLDVAIDRQTTRLECKIDDIMGTLLNIFGRKHHGS